MVEPRTIIPLSSPFSPSSDDNNSNTIIGSSSHQKSQPLKKARGRPLGSKNKLILPTMINQANGNGPKPIYINIPNNSDLIETVVQFARRYQVNFSVVSASGTISCATLHQTHSQIPTFIAHGPFTLVSLSGTYINNNPLVATSSLSSSNLNLRGPFSISFTSSSDQSFAGIVAGKVMTANKVTVVILPFQQL
ncbi:AT-hook motif nuclear-localized protein 17 [Cajanus cajan]|uniref:DNA-binding protein ESCAROLA n=1 Tax=Cajanus cajan TaxID=3821 RepID=A0A151TW55_CAJCA|nr:AT-hook motif nuclear-localized protein 17 [Cajanus cajan]KYP71293.1 Putative DNA-binding protein ESCAROLA [Cajanus cajan]